MMAMDKAMGSAHRLTHRHAPCSSFVSHFGSLSGIDNSGKFVLALLLGKRG
jgi:hypothetical protein